MYLYWDAHLILSDLIINTLVQWPRFFPPVVAGGGGGPMDTTSRKHFPRTIFPVEFSDKNCTIDRVRQIMIICDKNWEKNVKFQNGGHFTDFSNHENWKKVADHHLHEWNKYLRCLLLRDFTGKIFLPRVKIG